MEREALQRIKAHYTHYRQQLSAQRDRIKQCYLWYKNEQNEYGSNRADANAPQCRTSHLFNAIQFKHASLMDNYPQVNVLPREQGDEELAKTLSGIMPFILDNADFRRVYSMGVYDKLITGTAVYGVFYDSEEDEIAIERVDPLLLSYQPGVEDIQDSKYVFYDSLMDVDEFVSIYGEQEGIRTQDTYDDNTVGPEKDFLSKVVVITDCYYKTYDKGKKTLQFVKFSGDAVLDYTEGKDEYRDGLYRHGEYPFVVDVLHPDMGKLFGVGLVDVGKDTQAYIDKLDEIIDRNALISAEPRHIIKESLGINAEDLLDIKKRIISCTGDINDGSYKELKPTTLPAFIYNHRESKIEELKEILGNRDFSQGGTTGGVTAASAITALQNTGNTLDRDMINASYHAFRDIIWFVIENVREFYTEEKTYRILGDDGGYTFVQFSNIGMQEHPVAGGIENLIEEGNVEDVASLFAVDVTYEKPLFDITLTVEKNNPYQRAQHNELILALHNMGLFNPETAEINKFVISNLNFDGKDKLLQQIDEMQAQQAQMQAQQQAMMAQRNAQMPQSGGEEMLAFPMDGSMAAPQDEMLAFPIG